VGRAVKARLALGAVVIAAAALPSACSVPHTDPLTIAVSASGAEPAPWALPLGDLAVRHAVAAVAAGDGAVSLVVAGSPEVGRVDLTPMRDADEVEQDPESARIRVQALLPRLRGALLDARPSTDGVDLLALFRRALEATPADGTVVLVSSGAQTADPLDLRRLGWDFVIPEVVADLRTRGLVPDAAGRRVEFFGLATVAGTQAELPLPAAAKLTGLWQAICVASGAASCTIHSGDFARTPSPSTRPVPVITVDATPTRCRGTDIVPGDVAFGSNDATLGPAADAALRPIAEKLAHCPGGRIAWFTGHTATVPSGDTGLALSARRAEAVRDRLARLGVPASVLGPATGAGSTRPLVDNMPGGAFSEELARLNRRVEITITEEH
jgi:outer membrane protein OmpA-like peptidoglycan-associated protein